MLASITPLGERSRGTSWACTTTIFICAGLLAGAACGAAMGLLGSVLLSDAGVRWRIGLVVLVLAAGLAWELSTSPVPGPRRQVNERWLDQYRRWVYAVGFGTQLGAGVTTIVVSSAVYAVWAAALASASPAAGATIGAIAGALRGATVLAGAVVVTPGRLKGFHSWMRSLHRPVRRLLLAAQLGLVGAASLAIVVLR
jgi:MFS family permease